MKRTHNNNLADSDDDMDDLPLKYISSNHKKVLSINELKVYSLQACEFCEKRFENRYDHLIHNSEHIIIPLINMLPYHCAECGLYCISKEEMNEHIAVKHKPVVKLKPLHTDDRKTKITDRFQFEVDNVKEEPNEDEIPLKCLIKKEEDIGNKGIVKKDTVKKDIATTEVVKKEPVNILQNFMMHCKVDVDKFTLPELYQTEDDCKIYNVLDTCESNYKNPVAAFGPSIALNYTNSTRKIDEAILKNKLDLKTFSYNNVIKSDVENFKNPRADADSSSEFLDLDDDPIVILAPVKKQVETESVRESVHFDDLTKPGIFYCKQCFKRFPNRFEVIVHQAAHLYLRKTAPVGYKVAHKHSTSSVPLASGPSKQVRTCNRCNEEVSDEKLHAKTCYRLFCSACAKSFKKRSHLRAHEQNCTGEAVVNLCDKCLYMRPKPKNINYCGIMRYNNPAVKQVCHWCGELTGYMSLVTIVSKNKLKDRIRFEDEEKEAIVPDSCVSKVNEEVKSRNNGKNERCPGRAPKFLSNRERLKLIQQRLKLMKK